MKVEANPDGSIGPVPGLCYVVIRKVNNADPVHGYPDDVNVAAAFTYDVDFQSPIGANFGWKKATVDVPCWPSPKLVQAFKTGQRVIGLILDGAFFIMTAEMPWTGPCVPVDTGGGNGGGTGTSVGNPPGIRGSRDVLPPGVISPIANPILVPELPPQSGGEP